MTDHQVGILRERSPNIVSARGADPVDMRVERPSWGQEAACYCSSMALDPEDLRSYASRDWSAPERLARRARAQQPVSEKVRIAIELYEAARRTRPDWPTDEQRKADLAMHLRLRALLDRAAHVGAR